MLPYAATDFAVARIPTGFQGVGGAAVLAVAVSRSARPRRPRLQNAQRCRMQTCSCLRWQGPLTVLVQC
eukprot:350428-Chlamydomonas_euryale.AAC.7